MPALHKVAGQPVVATWASGSVAELRLNRNPVVDISVPFQVTENLCSPSTLGQQFKFNAAFRADRFRWIWTKHADAKKVGAPVKFKGGSDNPIEFPIFVSNPIYLFLRDMKDGFPRDYFEFSDVSWIPGMQDSKLGDFSIASWFTEKMRKNPQTGINENRVVAELSGLRVVREGESRARIESMDSVSFANANMLLLTLGDVVTWVFSFPDHDCQISMKPDLGEAQRQLSRYGMSLNDDTIPYLWNQDGLTSIIEGDVNVGGPTPFLFEYLEYADDQ